MDNLVKASTSSVDVRPKIINGKIIWSGGPSLKQQFSLPHSIMYYMAKNPSTSTSYLKLIQSCKYFFEKNPIIVVNTMGEIHLCSNDEYACEENENKCCVYPDYFAIPKFWIIHDLQLYNNAVHIPDFTSFLRPKLFRSEVLFLTIVDKTVYFDDFVLLAGCAKLVDLRSVEMIHEDGSVVMLEEIIDVIPNVVDFYYTFGDDSSMINDATFANIRKLKKLRNCAWFSLYNVPEVINVADLAAFAKGRKKYPEYFYIEFSGNNNLSAVYRYQLNALLECLYADAIAEYKSEKFWEYVKFGFETLIYPFFIR